MTDIATQQPGTPAIDYENVKEYFFGKLSGDLYGRGRMESALYHTAQWIFLQGCHERERLLAEIAELSNERGFSAGDMAEQAAKAYREGSRFASNGGNDAQA